VILGNSNTPSALGVVMPLFHWAMPSRYHSIHKNDLARAMVEDATWVFLVQQVDIYATRDRVTWTPRADQWMPLHDAIVKP